MLPLRFGAFWLTCGLLAMAALLGLTLAPLASAVPIALAMLDDKVAHFLAFLFLMLWFGGVFRSGLLPWVALGLMAFGVLIELLQSQLPYRAAEFADALSDFGGVLLGWLLTAAGTSRWTAAVESLLRPKPSR